MQIPQDLKGLTKKIEQLLGVTGDKIQQICNDTLKIYKPKEKKTIEINGKSCEMSLIEDGRIMIQFPDIIGSEVYFKEPPVASINQVKMAQEFSRDDGYKKGVNEGRFYQRHLFNKQNWFKRLFTTWL